MRSGEMNMMLWCARFADALASQLEEAIAAGPGEAAGALDAFDRVKEALPTYTVRLTTVLDRARELIGEQKVWTPKPLDAVTEARIRSALASLPKVG